jgi:hypothetical protein
MVGWMDAQTHAPTCRPQGCGIENTVSKERGHVFAGAVGIDSKFLTPLG